MLLDIFIKVTSVSLITVRFVMLYYGFNLFQKLLILCGFLSFYPDIKSVTKEEFIMEDDKAFMERLQKEKAEKVEQAKQGFEESRVLQLETGKLYRFVIEDAWGKQDDAKGDYMGFKFSNSGVFKGHKGDENTFYVRKGQMRTLRNMVLRDLPDNPKYPELESGVAPKTNEPILVKVPEVKTPTSIQFVIVEEPVAKGSKYENGWKHILGEPVEKFAKTWEAEDAFVKRIQKEKEEYLKTRLESVREDDGDDAGKLGHKELGVDKPFHVVLTRAMAPKENPSYMIFHIDTEKSKLWSGYNPAKDGKFNRIHMSALTLKTFMKILDLPPKDGGAMIQVGMNTKTKQPEYVQVPNIPAEGVEVRFYRQARKSADYEYKECLGEKL